MKRWTRLVVFGVICLFVFSGLAEAKATRIAVVRNIGGGKLYLPMVEGLKAGLGACGFSEGVDVEYITEEAFSSKPDGIAATTAKIQEAVAQGVDIVVSCGTAASAGAWKVLKGTGIPQIYVGVTNPVSQGFITKEGVPSGKNITGITYYQDPQDALSITRRIMPEAKVYGFVYMPSIPQDLDMKVRFEQAQNKHGFTIEYIDMNEPGYEDKVNQPNIDVFNGWLGIVVRRQEVAEKIHKPHMGTTSYGSLTASSMGGYALDTYTMGQQAAVMVAKIISGQQTPDRILPELPQKQVIMINMKNAEKYGIKIPFDILVEAEVILE
jgi:putative ABC transport system substrate-binding protein